MNESELKKILEKGYCKVNKDNTTVSSADLESNTRNAPVPEKGFKGFDSPVCILVRSFRHRLADPDGVSAKAAIDGLVHAKILTDDSPKEVKSVSYEQIKIKKPEEEKTEIIITEVE